MTDAVILWRAVWWCMSLVITLFLSPGAGKPLGISLSFRSYLAFDFQALTSSSRQGTSMSVGLHPCSVLV